MRTLGKTMLVLGLVALAVGLAAAQQRPQLGGFTMGFGNAPEQLLANKSVQEELKLTKEQIDKVPGLQQKAREKLGDVREKLKGTPPEQFMQKMQELRKPITEEVYKAAAEFLQPEQITRLKQIELQRAGHPVFTTPEVEKALQLTAEQKDKIKTIAEDANKEMREAGRPMGGNLEEFRKKMAALQKDTMEKMIAILTADQKKAWQEMTGKPFEYKAEPFRPFEKKGG